MARGVCIASVLALFACGGSEAAGPEPARVTALPETAGPAAPGEMSPPSPGAEGRATVSSEPSEIKRVIRFRVVTRGTGQGTREWDLARDSFRVVLSGWRCLVGEVRVSRSAFLAHGGMSTTASETRAVVCKKGSQVKKETVACGYATGQVDSAFVVPPVAHRTIPLDAYQLTLSCELHILED